MQVSPLPRPRRKKSRRRWDLRGLQFSTARPGLDQKTAMVAQRKRTKTTYNSCDVTNDEEESTTMAFLEIQSNDNFNSESVALFDLHRFSNFTKVLRVIAFMGKFISKWVEIVSHKEKIYRPATFQDSQPRHE